MAEERKKIEAEFLRMNKQLAERDQMLESLAYLRDQAEAKKRRVNLILWMLVVAALPFLLYLWDEFREANAWWVPTSFAGAGLFVLLSLYYLRPNSKDRPSPGATVNFGEIALFVDQRIKDALKMSKGAAGNAMAFTREEKAAALQKISENFESEALGQQVDRLREEVIKQVQQNTLEERFSSTCRRLYQEVQDLAKRGNLNLILGILTTLVGVSILGYAVFNLPGLEATAAGPESTVAAGQRTAEVLTYFVPRVSLVILIEVFAYFFLRLYKQSLSEIKYFQNEITNIEAKNLALQVALRSEDLTLRSKIVEALAETERNFVLTKDQTTVDLERERIASNGQANVIDMFKELFKAKAKN